MEQTVNYKDTKLKPVRKVIAKNMMESLQSMAQLTLNTSFNAEKLLSARKAYKANADEDIQKITINDMILYAVAQVLPAHPALNSYFLGDVMRTFSVVNLGIAVDTPRGLLVPNVMEAEKMTLRELSKAAKALVAAAQSGKVSMDLMTNGTFTVTNLGSLGIESFTPVINPPQTGILGVCTTVNRFDNEGKRYPAIGLSLTFDHRALDGAPAARFLRELCVFLENWDIVI